MILQRHLDEFEAMIASRKFAGIYTAVYLGKVSEIDLRIAFDLLCTKHPILRGRILAQNEGHLLQVDTSRNPDISFRDGLHAAYLREIQSPWDAAQSVARLAIIRHERGGFVVLRVDHAVADGRSGVALFEELWQVYTDIAQRIDIPAELGTMPVSPSSLLAHGARGKIFKRPSKYSHLADGPTASQAVRQRIRLTDYQTGRLVNIARANKVSIHAIVCGAILVSQRDQVDSIAEPTPMVCWSPVDLRPRLNPPVGATETTNLLSAHKAEVTLSKNDNPIAIAGEIKEQLNAALTRGDLPPNPLHGPGPGIKTPLDQRRANAIVSNIGVISTFRQPPTLNITDFWVTDYASVFLPVFPVSTYCGRLSIEFLYPGDHYQADQVNDIAEQTRSHLIRIGATAT